MSFIKVATWYRPMFPTPYPKELVSVRKRERQREREKEKGKVIHLGKFQH